MTFRRLWPRQPVSAAARPGRGPGLCTCRASAGSKSDALLGSTVAPQGQPAAASQRLWPRICFLHGEDRPS